MAEYYGYAERDANAYVDWGKLGENLTETVQAAYKIRADRKKALDDVMQENYNELANAPSGLNQDINKAVTSHVGNTKQFLLQANKLLKAGILRPEDYTLIMQNQKEDNKAIFDNAKNWQTAWAKIQDDVISGKGSKAMQDIASGVASFGKFNNTDFMINPVTGRVNASKMITNANGEKIKGESMSMQQLNVLMNQNIDKYKLTEKLTSVVDALGENQISLFRAARIQANGQITEIKDKSLKASFDAAKNGFINEVMANPFNVMSILTDHQGVIPGTTTPYRVSTNPADRGKADVIFYSDPDGDGSYTPEISAAQRKAAEDFTTNQFLGLIDREEKNAAISEISQTTAATIGLKDQAQRSDTFGELIGLLVSGTPQQKRIASAALNNMKDAEGNAIGNRVEVNANGEVFFTDSNGRINPFNVTGVDKENAGMQMYTMYAAPFELDKNKFKRALMNAGAKTVTKYEGQIRAQAGQKKAATDNTGTGGNSSGKTVGGILGIQ